MLLVGLGLGFAKRFPATMPLAACCSASLAAVCQSQGGGTTERDITVEKLKWGVIESQNPPEHDGTEIGHAGFSAEGVSPLIERRTYT